MVARYETGVASPTVRTLARLLRAAGRELVLSGAEPSSAGPPRPVAALLKEHRAAIRAAAAAVGARNVRVFGSAARGEETAESDVDLLVDFPAGEQGLFPLLMLAEAKSLSDLFTRVVDLNVAGARAATLKSSLDSDLADLQAQREREQTARDEEVTTRDMLTAELSQLRALQAQQAKAMADLETKIAETRWEISRLNHQSAQLAQQVTDMLQQQEDAIIAAAMQSVWAQLQLWLQSNSVGQIPTSAGHSTRYRFIWPEPKAQISQGFGPSSYWFEPPYGTYPHFHTGIDLVEPFGSPVFAADDGVVALVGSTTTGYGTYVVIAHAGGFDTLYGHLSTALVKVGQPVTQGTVVGLEGSSGSSTGPHLHFELRINQRPVDPTPYLPPGAPSAYRA